MSSDLQKTLNTDFDDALGQVRDALKAQGFGVLTEIDVQDTLKQKIGAELRRYRILGACNPPFAYQAIQVDPDAGVMMPCNVVVYENDKGTVTVTAVDPTKSALATGNPQLVVLAGAVREKLAAALR
ncbi:MAG: DUF302 domain-containing protein [Polyangiales bacterium]|nr:DUF302 domain-containing protein [Myxococcales bacterium]